MNPPRIWMFSGQGSQYYQMGRDLFETEPVFRKTFEQGARVAEPLIQTSLVEVVYRERANRFEPFDRTLFTHPAIFLVELALAKLLLSKGLKPDFLFGYSIGEFVSAVVAGVLTENAALLALIEQARLMEQATAPSGMLAVLESMELRAEYPAAFGSCEIAGRNYARGFIVVGPIGDITRLRDFLRGKGISFLELPVTRGFHSRAMDPIEGPYLATLKAIPFAPPEVPMLSAQPSLDVVEMEPVHLWRATRDYLDFKAALERLETRGPFVYVDLGPSGTMATLVKHNLAPGSASAFFPIITPFGRAHEHLARVMGAG